MQGNSVCLVGRLGRDPECRFFGSGSVVANVSLAVNRPKKDAPPDWFELEVWGKTAEIISNYCRKGSQIGVTGSIYSQGWQDRETGADRSKPVLLVDRVTLLGSAKNGGSEEYDEF